MPEGIAEANLQPNVQYPWLGEVQRSLDRGPKQPLIDLTPAYPIQCALVSRAYSSLSLSLKLFLSLSGYMKPAALRLDWRPFSGTLELGVGGVLCLLYSISASDLLAPAAARSQFWTSSSRNAFLITKPHIFGLVQC